MRQIIKHCQGLRKTPRFEPAPGGRPARRSMPPGETEKGQPYMSMAGLSMEARGIEPRSETRTTTASTCVVHRWIFPPAGRQTTHRRMSPQILASCPRARRPASSIFRYQSGRLERGILKGRCINPVGYAANARLVLAVKNFPSDLSGSRVPEHAATASPTPSKPVAPYNIIYTSGSGPLPSS
jgi:hypothetical protein